MPDLLETDYFGTVLRDCLPAGAPLPRAEFARLLTDDVRLHVLAGRVAAADRGALTALISREGVDVPALFRRLTDAHTARMTAAGLNN